MESATLLWQRKINWLTRLAAVLQELSSEIKLGGCSAPSNFDTNQATGAFPTFFGLGNSFSQGPS